MGTSTAPVATVAPASIPDALEFRPRDNGTFDEIVARFADGMVHVETMSNTSCYVGFYWDDGRYCQWWINSGKKLEYHHEHGMDKPPRFTSQGIDTHSAKTEGLDRNDESPVGGNAEAPTTPAINQGEAEILRERTQIVAWLREDADMTEAESRKIISNSHGLKPRDIGDWRNLVATKRGIADAIERGDHLTAQGGEA